jgi:hypothetical protein
MQHFNKLTPAMAERLALLAEELGEAQQVIGKILRHGAYSKHPDGGPPNIELLERELGDIQAAISLMVLRGDMNSGRIGNHCLGKQRRMQRYLHHNDVPEWSK